MPPDLAVVPAGALALGEDLVPTAGSWETSAGTARFTPRFAAVPGTEHAVVTRSDGVRWRVLARVSVPVLDRTPSTVVDAIDPRVDVVPANLLRFAIRFSSPMEEGSAADRIRLLDERGGALPGTLLGMPPELWDRDRRRLTVLLEPGRIKRGLQPNVLAGAPLQEGGTVRLLVDAGIRDAEGAPLLTGASRSYRVGPPIRSRVDPTRWQVSSPDADGEAVRVRFDRPLDRALVLRHLAVLEVDGSPVRGRGALDDEALVWTFTPAEHRGGRRIRVDARLEDLAGNSVRRVFDRDLDRPEDASLDAPEVLLTI